VSAGEYITNTVTRHDALRGVRRRHGTDGGATATEVRRLRPRVGHGMLRTTVVTSRPAAARLTTGCRGRGLGGSGMLVVTGDAKIGMFRRHAVVQKTMGAKTAAATSALTSRACYRRSMTPCARPASHLGGAMTKAEIEQR